MIVSTNSASSNTSNIVIYVSCHYDFSHLEFVAPFLAKFHGSKCFIYKWNGLKQKIRDHYLSPEYQAYGLKVYDFTLETIVSCILREEPGKKIVFLQTASLAYAFGQYQRKLLQSLADLFPDRVHGVTAVGHCLYGCMSCSGNDHRIPVYFTRYFCHQLTYTAETIRKQYLTSPKAKPVLVAPSTGETTLILDKDILSLLLRLQQEGKYEFIFKLHPACFNHADYDMDYHYHVTELNNLKFIFANFRVTSEEQPCLLPFFEAFETIICDLHSSVGFTASYFAPRTIIAYHNDAFYEVPERDPKFLANLNVFDNVEMLEKYLVKDTLVPKGSPEFFYQTYGKVDGNEVDRFAKAAKWPLTASNSAKIDGQPTESLARDWRVKLRAAVNKWKAILKQAIEETQKPDKDKTEDHDNECKLAMGIDNKVPIDIGDLNALEQNTINEDKAAAARVKIMSFNVWHGTEAHPNQPKLSAAAKTILDSGADIVGLQELAGLHPPGSGYPHEGKTDKRHNRIEDLVKELERLDASKSKWYHIDQGIITPGAGSLQPWGIISRLPVVSTSPSKWGAAFNVPSSLEGTGHRKIWLFNSHLPYFPYQPYQLSGIQYENSPMLRTEQEAVKSSEECRGKQMCEMIAEIKVALEGSDTDAVFVSGDFNEPSFQDWSVDAYIAGIHPIVCKWPQTHRLCKELGMVDAYRKVKNDVILDHGFTWNPRKLLECNRADGLQISDPFPAGEHHDRIDFVFYRDAAMSVRVDECSVIGAQLDGDGVNKQTVDEGVVNIIVAESSTDWPSDHRAVVCSFSLV